MMLWRLFKSAGKWAVVAAIIIGSTAGVLIWRATYALRHPSRSLAATQGEKGPQAPPQDIEANPDHLLTVDNYLYDVVAG
jgi:hypothetical protein